MPGFLICNFVAGYHLSLTFDIFLQFEILQNSYAVEHFFLTIFPSLFLLQESFLSCRDETLLYLEK